MGLGVAARAVLRRFGQALSEATGVTDVFVPERLGSFIFCVLPGGAPIK